MKTTLLVCVVLLGAWDSCTGAYFFADYYMDPKVSSSMKGACGNTNQDDFSYINSNIHIWNTRNYGNSKDCEVTYDRGTRGEAWFKLWVDLFKVESSTGCTKDVLEIHNGTTSQGTPRISLCGSASNADVNITGLKTTGNRYLTFRWRTDGSGTDKGFRVAVLRYEEANVTGSQKTCRQNDANGPYFLCEAESICIDPRLKCDGTEQCTDGSDENDCSGWDKFVGGLLRMGLEGICSLGVGLVLIIIILAVGIALTVKFVKKYKAKKLQQKIHASDDVEKTGDASQDAPTDAAKAGSTDKARSAAGTAAAAGAASGAAKADAKKDGKATDEKKDGKATDGKKDGKATDGKKDGDAQKGDQKTDAKKDDGKKDGKAEEKPKAEEKKGDQNKKEEAKKDEKKEEPKKDEKKEEPKKDEKKDAKKDEKKEDTKDTKKDDKKDTKKEEAKDVKKDETKSKPVAKNAVAPATGKTS